MSAFMQRPVSFAALAGLAAMATSASSQDGPVTENQGRFSEANEARPTPPLDEPPFFPDAPDPEALPPFDELEDPIPFGIPRVDPQIRLEVIADGLTSPVVATHAPGMPQTLFVADQDGQVYAVNLNTQTRQLVLNVSNRLVPLEPIGDERGLLGLAFHPNFQINGLFYTYTSEPATETPDYSTMPTGVAPDHQNVVLEWQMDPMLSPVLSRELLRIDHPQPNHNAGCLAFGPDGLLYISIGDGGGADDRDGQLFNGVPIVGHGLDGNGQKIENPLGKILRIDPLGNTSPNHKYGIPPENPFVGMPGLDEIFAYGLRNPYRFSFDRITGQMLIGDVGQNDIEEVDLGILGANYGWREREGSFRFMHNGGLPGFVVALSPGPSPFTDPIVEYDHDEGVAVVGGFIYRGPQLPQLFGFYLFGDYTGRLFISDNSRIAELSITGQDALQANILSFGEDARGEVYVLTNETFGPTGTTGKVRRFVSPRP